MSDPQLQPARRRRPSFATVVALLALVVALGGTSYAAAKINGKELVNNSVPGKKLVGNSVNGNKINESSLGWVPRAKKAKTVTGSVVTRTASVNVADQSTAVAVATCKSGEKRVGGGGYFTNGNDSDVAEFVHLVGSFPNGSAGWAARGWNDTGASEPLVAYALCLTNG